MQLLKLYSSIYGEETASYELAQAISSRLAPVGAQVLERDLAAGEIPHLDAETHIAFNTPEAERSEAQRAALALSDTLLAEVKAADTIILTAPLYNFGIPSELKAWIDHIARPGESFQYTSNGPQGLLTGKRLIIVATRGGKYAGTDADTQTAYLKQVFGFVGITEIEFVYAEGLAMAEGRESAMAAAQQIIEQLAA